MSQAFTVNDREYVMPNAPVVVICIDGSEPAYHEEALAAGRMPWLADQLRSGASSWPAHCAMPALTNPNNLSIATGQPPRRHGICGNYILDPDTGEEVLMNDKRYLRAPTLFAAANEAGLDVAVVTAKDKLRRLLGAGVVESGPDLNGGDEFVEPSRTGICFSAEKADQATEADNGIGNVLEFVGRPLPEVYSADLSEFVLAAGVRILTEYRPDLLYLSLTDYIQHKHAPGTPVANDFYAMIDHWSAQLDQQGAIVVLTADHGMSAKSDATGAPQVIYVEEQARTLSGSDDVVAILPITDPYTVHHGALGSFASLYLGDGIDPAVLGSELARIPGVQAVHTRADAAERYGLPLDRIGDLVVLAEKGHALGRTPQWHDLTQLDAPLRSHGALGELRIPFIINRSLPEPPVLPVSHLAGTEVVDRAEQARVHNYDAFWVATTVASRQSEGRSDA
ncbi:MAG TPA: phosphonoacetate hydrolase [Candidatus Avipropionibacterium avicola]|uniref:Phosphonoacetate hydrolase n=1 Tax=Candidatus Avipropionibacterium avicola TaxID=2840701 RepID=A0A9D1GYB7_9ACTN|nr:phosphonoacetate hydrolase [Candidatus Avipropionibacterium avicola]